MDSPSALCDLAHVFLGMRFWLVVGLALLLLAPYNSLAASPHVKTYTFTWRSGFRYHATPWGPVDITAMTCPNTHRCAAADSAGDVLTTSHPREGMRAWLAHDVQAGGLYTLACPSVKLCLADYGYTGIQTTTNLFGPAPKWRHAVIAAGSNQSVGNITCAGVSFCLALSSPETGGGFFVSSSPSANRFAWKFVKPQFSEISNMACPSPKLCVGASYGRIVYSRTPAGSASSWKSFQIGLKPQVIVAISCPSITFCAAVDQAGNVYSSRNPAKGPGAWRQTDINGQLALSSIACSSSSVCVASDGTGTLFTSSNPGGGAWHAFTLKAGEAFGLYCPTPQLCLALGAGGDLANSSKPGTGKRRRARAVLRQPHRRAGGMEGGTAFGIPWGYR
jgi:hypothetical protein